MVVGKVLRWSPWGPSPQKRAKFEATVTVAMLDGLVRPMFGHGDVVTVRIRCKKDPKSAGDAVVGPTGEALFGFGHVCHGSDSGPWELTFSVLHKSSRGQRKKEKKLEEIGTISADLGEWLRASQISDRNAEVEGKRCQAQVQRKKLPITLEKDGLIAEATLHISVSFLEIKKPQKISQSSLQIANSEDNKEEEGTSDDSCTVDPDNLDLYKLLVLADETDKVVEFKSRSRAASSSSSARSSPDQPIGSVSKRRLLPWGKTSKISNRIYEGEESVNRVEDPFGTWESLELVSRDRQTMLKAQAFFASIDQRDESAGGESACTALVAVIADALHSRGSHTPNRQEFDALIREGSLEWQKMCNKASHIDRFPNKHFDLDAVLEAKIRPVSVVHEKSFVGFFQPESFESLRGAMSFDAIWNEITKERIAEGPRIHIVSWNDHFFLLKLDTDACYIIDTLGERLYEGCTKAYILKFDDDTQMCRLTSEEKEEDGDDVICRGKECCREFIKRFLAAIPLREELETEEKGNANTRVALHQRLQIEFHLTEASSSSCAINGDQ